MKKAASKASPGPALQKARAKGSPGAIEKPAEPAPRFRFLTREGLLAAELPPAKQLLRRVATRIAEGAELDRADLLEIGHAFEQILAGVSPTEALGLAGKQGQGRPSMTFAESNVWFVRVFRVEQLRAQSGMRKDEAIDQVVLEERLRGDGSLRRWHDRYRRQAKSLLKMATESLDRADRAQKFADQADRAHRFVEHLKDRKK